MQAAPPRPSAPSPDQRPPEEEDGDLADLLGELRVLVPGAETLTAFLIILPFTGGFDRIRDEEKVVYIVTFLCSVASLVLFTAPAAHHRLQRPLRDREGFKTLATRLIIAGLIPLSAALVLATQLVMSEVVPVRWVSWLVSGLLGAAIVILWWIVPARRRARLDRSP
ncbi:MAG TPA: DUF6328 family protein [Thermomicrobiales bacterium]|nr:DUF6328 family protein [Thermomicrobiales bacterium]